MRTCPHCQFLVADGATSCSVCKNELPAPVPVGMTQGPFAAPGQVPGGARSGPPQFVPQHFGAPSGAQGAPFPPGAYAAPGAPVPPTRSSGPSTGKVLAIVAAAVGVVALLGVGSLFLLGTTAERAIVARIDLEPKELDWQVYDDPAGAYSLELPGDPHQDTVELPESYGVEGEIEAVSVSHPTFNAGVGLTPDVVVTGATFDNLPFSPTGVERAMESTGLDGAEVISHEVVEGSGGLAMDLELRGTVDGEDGLVFSRVVISGNDVYEINVMGPLERREALEQIHDRLTSTFTQPV